MASVTAYSSKVIMIYRYSVVDRRGVGKKLYAKATKVVCMRLELMTLLLRHHNLPAELTD